MKRAGIVLLIACTVLAVGSVVGGLAGAASRAAYERFGAPDADETPEPSHFVCLPMVAKDASPEPTWVTVADEDFEAGPGDLWRFYDQSQQGLYFWGPRDCRSNSPTRSAWAFGGGTLGASLPCQSGYPANVDSRMVYGPFSLQDATDAYWRFSLWLDRGDAWEMDEFCWYADIAAKPPDPPRWGECLNFDTGTWYTRTINLSDPAINVLGEPEVWIGFRFNSRGTGSQAEGAYVDDVLIRKCVGGTCPAVGSSAPVGADSP